MSSLITQLADAAGSLYEERAAELDSVHESLAFMAQEDAVLSGLLNTSFIETGRHEKLGAAMRAATDDRDLRPLRHIEGTLDPFLMHSGGGSRLTAESMIVSIFSNALQQMFLFRLPSDESTFVRLVLEGFEELKRGIRGERIRGYDVAGLAGIALGETSQISTAWGIVRPAPPVEEIPRHWVPRTTCTLATPRLIEVAFSREASPEAPKFESSDVLAAQRGQRLIPLACALASPDERPSAPIVTWATTLLPFRGGWSFSKSGIPLPHREATDFSDLTSDVEEWARIIDREHSPNLDLAARRLVSSIAHRFDETDALVDAVMTWESLLGTRTETTYRVTAAISKLLEPDPSKRASLRKELAHVYDVRSRVVHGEAAEGVDEAATRAIAVGLQLLRAAYRRGGEWLHLKSSQRNESLLLS